MDVPDASAGTQQRLCTQVAGMITDLLRYSWLQGTAMPRVSVERLAEEEGTEAIILHANVNVQLAVKLHFPHGGKKEEEGYRILSEGPLAFRQHLLAPLVPNASLPQPLWLAPYVNADTLHAVACGMVESPVDGADVRQLYVEFLTTMKELWLATKVPAPAHLLNILYLQRIQERKQMLARTLGMGTAALNRHLIEINGVPIGTFGKIIDAFGARVRAARMSLACLTHGDEHAKNVMVYRDGESRAHGDEETKWVLIDYTHARRDGDWVFSVARMLYWWRVYCVLELAKTNRELRESLASTWDVAADRLAITYDETVLANAIPPLCRTLDAFVMDWAQAVASEFGEAEQDWKERLALAFFTATFAAAVRHLHLKLPGTEFTVPIMIGESLKAIVGP